MSPLPDPVNLRVAAAHGASYAHGAHVVSWAPAGSGEVLFVSRDAIYDSGTAIRGGIPVIFPWFGPGRTPGMSPSHGFARTAAWHLVSVEDGPDIARVHYRLTHHDATSDWWLTPFEAGLTAEFGEHLRVSLAVKNLHTEHVSYEDALHAYFRVGDVERISISGLEGAEYSDKTLGTGATTQRQNGRIVIVGETDRVYASTGPVMIHDPSLRRDIVIEKSGSTSTVVWNPWVELAAKLADLADDEWREFVCVEVGNALEDAVVLAPGEAHITTMKVSLG